jgi:hypothetical protein
MMYYTVMPVAARRVRALLLGWGPTIVFSVVLPYLTYLFLTGHGMQPVLALVAAGGWPLIELVVFFGLHRRIDEFSVIILIFLGLNLVTSLAFSRPQLVLVKDSALTGLFGVVLLVTLLMPRPLMFYLGRKFGTDGSPAGVTRWNSLWQYASFRRSQRVITGVWGMAFLGEALLRIGLSLLLPLSLMVVISAVLPIVIIAALITWTFAYARRVRAAAAQRAPAALA